MDENGNASKSAWRIWLKRVGLALGAVVLLLLVFHRPILQTIGRRLAIHFAAQQNLKLDFRLEGSILGGLVMRNVHASATGPSALRSADVDFMRVDYSLWDFMTKGMAELLQTVEVRNANIVLDPEKAPPVKDAVDGQKISLPAFFPEKLTLSDVNVRVKSEPNDLVLEHLSLDLNPTQAGELKIGKLQLASGRSWKDVTAQTTYKDKNLFLRDLVLDEKTHLKEVNLDASEIGAGKLEVGVDGTFAGAKIKGNFALGEKDKSLKTKIDFAVEDTSLQAVTDYFKPAKLEEGRVKPPVADVEHPEPSKLRGAVKRLAVKGEGQFDQPNSWNGTIKGELKDLEAGGVVFDSAEIDVSAAKGRAEVKTLKLTRGENSISLEGSADLPARTEEFGRVPATFQLRADIPKLGSLTAGMAQPITGPAEVNGEIKVRDATVYVDLVAVAGPVDFGQGTVEHAVVKLQAAKKMPPPLPDEEDVGHETVPPPYWTNLTSEIELEMSALRYGDYAVDSVNGKVHTAEKKVTLDNLIVQRAANRLTLNGRYELPQDFANVINQPGSVDVSLQAPSVGDFWVEGAAKPVTGAVELYAQTDLGAKLGGGWFNLYATNLQAQNLTVPEISARGTVAENVIYLTDLTAQLNERDYVRAFGNFSLDAPRAYDGKLEVNIANLSTLEPLLRATGNETKLAGALEINWEGKGAVSTFPNTGNLKLTLRDGRFGDLEKLEANVEANYTPQELNVPIIYAASDKLMFQAIMQAKDQKLEITKIQVIQGDEKYADGYVALPFVWENVGKEKPLFPAEGEVLVNFQTKNLDIKKLAKDLGTTVPVAGLADIKLDAQGTIDNLRATLDLQLTGLRSEQLQDFKPATFGLNARLENNQLVVTGKLEQARIQPVEINASLPLDVAKLIENKKLDETTPIKASVRMPSSSINFARQFVPALERIDGNLALDVNVDGTIGKPSLSGSAVARINAARFGNPTLPALTNFNARLAFTGDRLAFEQFKGELAGGPFTLSGQVTFPKLTEPNLDLRLRADAVLVARNDDLNVRTDADITIEGPFDSATVAGTIGITNSKFLKNLDLIPIGVPGRPPPAPEPPETGPPELSFPDPPLRDWKFDLKITTKNPFDIRGNLAKGAALVDMRVTGTGLNPLVDGTVRLQNVEISLPFSRLEITRGVLYFNPQDPFNPSLEIQGTSLIQDYTVQVNIYGTANQPEAVFSSQPPLPQEDIITLLSTGVTREQLASGGNVLAGRALILLGKQLYQKVFKKESAADPNSFFDRLDVEVGGVDTRTGQQTATARYRLTDRIRLIGEIGVQGDFRGTVKYLIRFR